MSEEIPTAAFRYATSIIDYILEHTTEVTAETLLEYGYPVENPTELVRIFTGNIRGDISKEIGLSFSASQDGASLLNAMRCITTLKKAGRGIKSVYLVHYKPTVEQYKQFKERQGQITQRIAPSKFDSALRDIVDLRKRITTLEEIVANLELELAEHRKAGIAFDRHNL